MIGQEPAQADREVSRHERPFRHGWDDVAERLLHAGGDVRVGLRGQVQVVGGVADRRVPQVRLQDRQQRIDVLALLEPGPQVVDSHRVAQVMNPRAVSAAAVRDARLPQKPPEVAVDVPERQRHAQRGAGEEPLPAWLSGELGVVAGESFAQRLGDGQLPVLAAFRVTDLQHAACRCRRRRRAAAGLPSTAARTRRSCGTGPASPDAGTAPPGSSGSGRSARTAPRAPGRCRCAGRNGRASAARPSAARMRQRRGGEATGRAP